MDERDRILDEPTTREPGDPTNKLPQEESPTAFQEDTNPPQRELSDAKGRRKRYQSAPQHLEGEYNQFPNFFYSGFFIRMFAFLIDSILAAALSRVIVDTAFRFLIPSATTSTTTYYQLAQIFIFLVYFTVLTYATNGQTIGKMIFGIRVVSFYEPRLKLSTVLIREFFGRFIYTYAWLAALYGIAAFTNRKQHLIDLLTDTTVVTENLIKAYEMPAE